VAVVNFERKFGVKLPADYVAWTQRYSDQAVGLPQCSDLLPLHEPSGRYNPFNAASLTEFWRNSLSGCPKAFVFGVATSGTWLAMHADGGESGGIVAFVEIGAPPFRHFPVAESFTQFLGTVLELQLRYNRFSNSGSGESRTADFDWISEARAIASSASTNRIPVGNIVRAASGADTLGAEQRDYLSARQAFADTGRRWFGLALSNRC
jgi:hypothetical protein